MSYFLIFTIFAITVAYYVDKILSNSADDRLKLRLKRIINKDEKKSEVKKSTQAQFQSKLRKEKVDEQTQKSLNKLSALGVLKPDLIKEKLSTAGYRKASHLVIFTVAKLLMPLLLPFLFYMYNSYLASEPMLGLKFYIGLGVTFLAGYMGPDSYLQDKVKKRLQAIEDTYTEALDILLISIEAGSALESSLDRVVEEMTKTAPEIAEEFGILLAELSYLPERQDAFRNLAKRVPIEDVRPLVTAFVQSDKSGTPLAPALRVLSYENRRSRLAKAEKKAASLPAKLTVPLVLFIFPSLFVVILGPAAIDIMRNGVGG